MTQFLRQHKGSLARLVVAVLLLGLTLWQSNPRVVWRITKAAAAGPLLIAVALVLLDRALMAWRWFLLLRPIGVHTLPPFGTILRIFFVSTFVGTFLPASVGGDAVRVYSLSRHGVTAGDSVASVFLDRMLGVLSLLLMAVGGLVFVRDLATDGTVLLALGATAIGCVFTACLVFSERAEQATARFLLSLPWGRVRRFGEGILAAARRYSLYHRSLGLVLLASVVVQVLRIVQAYYLGMAVGLGQPLSTYFAFVPLILLVMLLPITVNGLGTSQAAFVWLFGRAGVLGAEAFALSILFVALGIVGNLPGALMYLREPRHLMRGTAT